MHLFGGLASKFSAVLTRAMGPGLCPQPPQCGDLLPDPSQGLAGLPRRYLPPGPQHGHVLPFALQPHHLWVRLDLAVQRPAARLGHD